MGIEFKTALVWATASGLALGTAAQAQTTQSRNFYVFGDVRSVNGNDAWVWDPANGYKGRTNASLSSGWEFRYSNGPSWVERLGYQLGLAPDLKRIQGPYDSFSGPYRGYNFAHYRASLVPNLMMGSPLSLPEIRHSADAQVDSYINQVRTAQIATSANDLYSYWFSPYGADGFPDRNVSSSSIISGSTATLEKIRAIANPQANILALGAIDATEYTWRSPQATGGLGGFLSEPADKLNSNLKALAVSSVNNTTSARIHFIDVSALIRSIRANPAQYGFTNVGPVSIYNSTCSPGCYTPSIGDWVSAKENGSVEDPNTYLWHSRQPATLTSRGNDILAYYIASTLGGVYAWDQFRAVGSGTGASAVSAISTIAAATTHVGFAQSMLGLSQVESAKGVKVFSLGLLDDRSGQMSVSQARGGSLKLIGSSVPLTPRLTVGGASFADQSRETELDLGVRGYGSSGFATLNMGQGLDLNVSTSSQNRTLNTNRPITFDYVGGVARATTRMRLNVAQASLSKMFDVRGLKIGPVASVASVTERWGETRERGVPEWLAANRPAGQTKSAAVNLGLAADWGMTDTSGAQWSLSAKAGRIQADTWMPIALVMPSQTLADVLEQEKGSASYATISAGRETQNGWSFGLESAIAQTEQRQVEALRARAALRF